jgi:orotate phosphoribosyltransferase
MIDLSLGNLLLMSSEIVDIRNWVLHYINDNCIYRVPPNEPELIGIPEGTTYRWQFYLRRGLTDQTFLRSIATLFWFQFKPLYDEHPFQIAGLETGATPLITALIMAGPPGCGGFIIRAERKKYGLFNQFEGCIDHRPVLLVDDMSNSKNTMTLAAHYCGQENLHIYKYGFVLVNKDVNAHPSPLWEKVKIISLFNTSDFHLSWESYNDYATVHKIYQKPWRLERNSLLNTKS